MYSFGPRGDRFQWYEDDGNDSDVDDGDDVAYNVFLMDLWRMVVSTNHLEYLKLLVLRWRRASLRL